jgi:Flp pilus assembly protein TadG
MRVQRRQDKTRRRGGFFSMELALTLPILGVVLFALFEFSLLFFARGEVVEACRVGARRASLPGATEEDVDEEIRRVLNPRLQQNMQVDVELGRHSGDVVTVAISVPMGAASPDLLWPIGYRLGGRQLFAATRLVRE